MLFLLGIVVLAYMNGSIAKKKGYNNIVWMLYTVGMFFLGVFVGAAVVTTLFYRGTENPQEIAAFLEENPISMLSILFFGLGGYLFIRYRIEKSPAKHTSD